MSKTSQESRDRWRYNNRHREWARLTILSHQRKGCEIQFTREWLEELAKNTTHCYVCGSKLNFEKKASRCPVPDSPSLDRKARDPVMTQDNIVIMCYACNTGKGIGTLDEYIARCKRIAKKYDTGDDIR
jgi:hypothetical protein